MMDEAYRQRRCQTFLRTTTTDPVTGCMLPWGNNGWYYNASVLGKQVKVHRFIAFSMLLDNDIDREANEHLQALHTCDNPPCINPKHLRLGTQVENLEEAITKNRYPMGELSWSAKLTQEQVDQIKELWASKKTTQVAIARKFGVSQQQISRIVLGKKWARA